LFEKVGRKVMGLRHFVATIAKLPTFIFLEYLNILKNYYLFVSGDGPNGR
ncbi:unnamed protein product, partial [marine sediment metagenome]